MQSVYAGQTERKANNNKKKNKNKKKYVKCK